MGRMVQNISIKIIEEIDRFARGMGPSVMPFVSCLFLVLDGPSKLLKGLAVSVGINELTWSEKIGGKTIDVLNNFG